MMKKKLEYLFLITSIFAAVLIIRSALNFDVNSSSNSKKYYYQNPTKSKEEVVVEQNISSIYVCISEDSYAFHNNYDCRGLQNCQHEIKKVTLKEARTKYQRNPCGFCYY